MTAPIAELVELVGADRVTAVVVDDEAPRTGGAA